MLTGTRRLVATAAVYTAAAVVFTWPLALHLQSLFGALDATGDPSLNLWTLGWDLRTISTHPAWLVTGRVFDANIFYPARLTLAYSDHLLLQALAIWPLYAITRDVVFCYNILLLVSLVASALTMHVLTLKLTGREAAAHIGGLVFAFAPYHFTHLTHLQLQSTYFLPLSFLWLLRAFETRRSRDGAVLGLVLGLQVLSSAYYGVIGAIGIACAAALILLIGRQLPERRLLRCGAVAVLVTFVVAAPWSIPYLRLKADAGAGRNLFEAAQASAVPASYLQAPPTNLLYGRSGLLTPGSGARLHRRDGPEQALFPGFVAILLAAAGAITGFARREVRPVALTFVAVGVVGFVLSLGPGGIRPLYSALYSAMIGMEAIRAAARFSVLTLCAIAVLAAYGASAALRAGGRAWVVVLALLIGVEYLNGSIGYPPHPVLTTEAGRWLAAQPGGGAVVCLPAGIDRDNTRCMLQSLEHGRPIVNGYSGLRPPFFPAVVDAMSRMPSPEGGGIL